MKVLVGFIWGAALVGSVWLAIAHADQVWIAGTAWALVIALGGFALVAAGFWAEKHWDDG